MPFSVIILNECLEPLKGTARVPPAVPGHGKCLHIEYLESRSNSDGRFRQRLAKPAGFSAGPSALCYRFYHPYFRPFSFFGVRMRKMIISTAAASALSSVRARDLASYFLSFYCSVNSDAFRKIALNCNEQRLSRNPGCRVI